MKEICLFGFILGILILSSLGPSFSEQININIDNTSYKKSDIISIWGSVLDAPQNLVFVTIKNFDGDTVWTEKILVDERGNFSTLVIAGINGWSKSGTYEILLESGSMNESTTFFYESGPQVNPPSAVSDFYISQEDLILTFVIATVVVAGIFVYLARNIILGKKTKYDKLDLDSKKNRDYEKYHSDWSEEELFSNRKNNSIDQKEFNQMLKNNTLPNYYQVLGISQSASKIEIKERFRILAKEWHPDKRKNSSEDKMIEINNAYEVLSDAHLREEYDKYYKFL